MDRKLLTFFVGLVVTIILRAIPITAQRSGGPPPSASISNQVIDESAEQRKRADERNQAVINELRALRTEITSIRDQTDRIEREKATQKSPGGPPLWSNWFLAGVAAAAAAFAWRTLKAIEKEVVAAMNVATATADTLTTNRDIERAYISVRPRSLKEWRDWPSLKPVGAIDIVNAGNTPARITHLRFNLIIAETDTLMVPDYGGASKPAGSFDTYLAAKESLQPLLHFDAIPEDRWLAFRNGENVSCWFVLYADYIDRFGRRHRFGMGCKMERFNQPGWAVETRRGFNYDRPRAQGEGDDWE